MSQDVIDTLQIQMARLMELRITLEMLKAQREQLQASDQATAIIIEPRKHRALSFVVKNVLENLPQAWTIRIYHGTENRTFVENLLATDLATHRARITLENLGVPDLPSARAYSEILLSKKFTEGIPTETFLVFQTDSMINPRNSHLLQKFLKYDYVGAPWKHGGVGNGGFSLRRRSKMLQVLAGYPDNPKIDHEDILFSSGSRLVRLAKPSAEEAKEFSMETVYTEKSFGIHRAWVYHPERLMEMCAACPGLETLIELQSAEEPSCTAIILEPRKHRALSFVVKNILENLPVNWSVRIYHGTENRTFVENLIATDLAPYQTRITLENLGVADLKTAQAYSEVLTSRKFTEGIPTETFLVFQTDSMINPRNSHLLQKFLKYDYVGAPWPWDWLQVGNGGFSLRKRSKMLAIIDSSPSLRATHQYEDHFFSIGSKTVKPFKPSAEEAREFSIEQVYTPNSFGIHKAWIHLPEMAEQLCADCPGLATLISLQGVRPPEYS